MKNSLLRMLLFVAGMTTDNKDNECVDEKSNNIIPRQSEAI